MQKGNTKIQKGITKYKREYKNRKGEIQKHKREYKNTRGNTKKQKRQYKIKGNTKEGIQNKQ